MSVLYLCDGGSLKYFGLGPLLVRACIKVAECKCRPYCKYAYLLQTDGQMYQTKRKSRHLRNANLHIKRKIIQKVNYHANHHEDLLHVLHWLPIRQRIHYKIATITYRALHLQQPSYISSLLVNYIPPWTLRSTSQGLLNTPGSPTVIGARRFSSAAPNIWSSLPYNVPSAETIGTFCTRLKNSPISRHCITDICYPATDSLLCETSY